jgi:uncharacterized protein (TIGR03435 family)
MRTIGIVSLLALASYALAQKPAYDVSTIRPSAPTMDGTNIDIDISESGFRAMGVTPSGLLQLAFDMPRERIVDLQSEGANNRYDITAKSTETPAAELSKLSNTQIRTMLQNLLVERFGLKWHIEKRMQPGFDLVFEKKADHLRPSATPPNPKNDEGEMNIHNRNLQATGVTIARLAEVMSNELHRPVVDKTEMKGTFDAELRWRRDDLGADEAAADDPNAPPLLTTAVREQLGLKLRSAHEMVEVLVVDRWQPPSPN